MNSTLETAVNVMLSRPRHVDAQLYTITYRTPRGIVRSKDVEARNSGHAIAIASRMIARNGYWGVTVAHYETQRVIVSLS